MPDNFGDYWDNLEDDPKGRHELVKLIVERVYMDEDAVLKMTRNSYYHLVLVHNANEPTEYMVDLSLYACGSDGSRLLTRIKLVFVFLPRFVVQMPFSNMQSRPSIIRPNQQKSSSHILN
jgi:hypothetical protein